MSDTNDISVEALLFGVKTADTPEEKTALQPHALREDRDDRLESVETKEDVLPSNETDALLVRLQHRDPQALATLFDKYCRLVFSIGTRVLRSPVEAEDLVQDVFLFLWSKSSLFVPGRRPGHQWIIRVTYHRAFDRRRYLMTRLSYNGGTQFARDTKQEPAEDRTARLVSKEENFGELLCWRSYLETAFEELSKDQRRTLKMFFYEGYTLSEISEKLGQPLMNIRNYYYRGLRKLSKCVANNK
jgi:RNA polymerase sigma-70 factor, ECF subfamily